MQWASKAEGISCGQVQGGQGCPLWCSFEDGKAEVAERMKGEPGRGH